MLALAGPVCPFVPLIANKASLFVHDNYLITFGAICLPLIFVFDEMQRNMAI